MSATIVAKKRTKPGPKPAPAGEMRDDLIAIRCRAAYKGWVQRFADADRSTPTILIDKALALLAKTEGFEPPPKR
jgi:hypothetical protein